MMKVLVVEDDPTQRLFLQKFFEKYGSCDGAETGLEAEALFRASLEKRQPYQLVCLDILLPDKSGQELLKLFRGLEQASGVSLQNRCRILMVTALKDLKDVTEAFASDCDGYLVKPVEPETIKQKLVALGLISP